MAKAHGVRYLVRLPHLPFVSESLAKSVINWSIIVSAGVILGTIIGLYFKGN